MCFVGWCGALGTHLDFAIEQRSWPRTPRDGPETSSSASASSCAPSTPPSRFLFSVFYYGIMWLFGAEGFRSSAQQGGHYFGMAREGKLTKNHLSLSLPRMPRSRSCSSSRSRILSVSLSHARSLSLSLSLSFSHACSFLSSLLLERKRRRVNLSYETQK